MNRPEDALENMFGDPAANSAETAHTSEAGQSAQPEEMSTEATEMPTAADAPQQRQVPDGALGSSGVMNAENRTKQQPSSEHLTPEASPQDIHRRLGEIGVGIETMRANALDKGE